MPLEDITDLLSFCLNTTQFVFDGTYYKQVFGTAMGSPVSAVIRAVGSSFWLGGLKLKFGVLSQALQVQDFIGEMF